MRMSQSLTFSRWDRRSDGVNVSRLDRFSLSDYFQESRGMTGILPSTSFSSHPQVCLCILEERRRTELHLRSVICDEFLKPQIQRIWSFFEAIPGTSREKLGVLLHESKVIFVEKSKLQFQGYKRKEKMLRATLTSLHRLQERDPNCDWIEYLLAKGLIDLKLNEQKKVKFLYYN